MKHKAIAVKQKQVMLHSYPPDKRGTLTCTKKARYKRRETHSYPPDKRGTLTCTKRARYKRRETHSYPPDKRGKGGYIPYNKALTKKARENRKNPTAAEKKLWYEVLESKRLDNLKFTRQKPLNEYIVDFYCAELMIAIEIDGDTHTNQEQYDKRRTENLNKYGVEVIRYTNAEVVNNLEGVYQNLRERISAIKSLKSETP